MRKNFRRIALGAVIAAGGIFGGVALALPIAMSGEAGGPTTGGGGEISIGHVEHTLNAYAANIREKGDNALGIGGTHPGPLPGPTPGLHPEDILNGAIQTVASGLDDAAQGLGGIHVGPLPAPTPGLHPEAYANKGIQTTASTLEQVAQGLGGIHVGPLPAPTPGLIPLPDTP